MKLMTYKYKGKDYLVHLLNKKEMEAQKKRDRMYRDGNLLRVIRIKLTRGYVIIRRSGYTMYILDEGLYSKIGRDRLIRHEIGHILGYKHTWKPTIMNATWVFRWFNRW